MSYRAWICIDTGAREPVELLSLGDMTSNISAIWTDALGCQLRDLNGTRCEYLIKFLDSAIRKLRTITNEQRYRAMEPTDGSWGKLEDAWGYLNTIYNGCVAHPKAYLRIRS